MSSSIGFIGAGLIGEPMAERLMAAGHRVVLVERNNAGTGRLAARGATILPKPADVASQASLVFACLTDNDRIDEVLDGPDGLLAGKSMRTFVNLGTSGSAFAAITARKCAIAGRQSLEAPITGGVKGAREGRLTAMVSGPQAAFDAARDYLKSFASKLVCLGEDPGAAQTLKLLNNLLSAAAFAVTAEAYVMARKANLDLDVVFEVLNAGSGRNSATEDKFPRVILPRTFAVGATNDTIVKDLGLCLEEAQSLGVPVWVGPAVRQSFLYAAALGGGKTDLSMLVRHLECAAGVPDLDPN